MWWKCRERGDSFPFHRGAVSELGTDVHSRRMESRLVT